MNPPGLQFITYLFGNLCNAALLVSLLFLMLAGKRLTADALNAFTWSAYVSAGFLAVLHLSRAVTGIGGAFSWLLGAFFAWISYRHFKRLKT